MLNIAYIYAMSMLFKKMVSFLITYHTEINYNYFLTYLITTAYNNTTIALNNCAKIYKVNP